MAFSAKKGNFGIEELKDSIYFLKDRIPPTREVRPAGFIISGGSKTAKPQWLRSFLNQDTRVID